MFRAFRLVALRGTRAHATHATSAPASERWSRAAVREVYHTPLLELVFRAASVHRTEHDPSKVQLCTLLNIKQGGCSEDCSYCSQSSRYPTPSEASPLLKIEPVIEAAKRAKANGSTRFCMGAAWRDMNGRRRSFDRILEMVRQVRAMDMEVCTTLGMLSPEQARQLKDAGCTAYNHNLDTSREHYSKVITTRTFDDRLETISAVRSAGISVCTGGILGLGESDEDRIGLIWETGNFEEHPESFPVNALVPIPGTPMENNEPIPWHTLVRTIATARVVMPGTIIRIAAGRQKLTEAEQALAFQAGANAIFTGDAMLTTPCSSWAEDKAMMSRLGLTGMRSFERETTLLGDSVATDTSESTRTLESTNSADNVSAARHGSVAPEVAVI